MLVNFNIIWLPMTGKEFCEKVISRLDAARLEGFKTLGGKGYDSDARDMSIHLVSDLAQTDRGDTEFLMGQEPVWSDIQNGKAAHRKCFDELWSNADKILKNTALSEFLIVTGTAGTGKSTALMWLALRLQSEGIVTAWLDAETRFSRFEFLKMTKKFEKVGALLINDADIYKGIISPVIGDLLARYPRLLVAIESRSSKVDSMINQYQLGDVVPREITMPHLCDSDIDDLISVLERENRLGTLKGKNAVQRVKAFRDLAGRQLLVAMYEATSGKKFADRAADELSDLTEYARIVYALVSAASAYRYSLTRDEVVIASGDSNNETLNTINTLIRRKLIVQNPTGEYLKARHRVVANLVYNNLVQTGQFLDVLRGLIMIGATKVNLRTDRNTRPSRLLRTFVNHNFMKRTVGQEVARNLYADFEDVLSWNSHYWLHRGALELEANELGLAENFLGQSMSLQPDDTFIQTEWAYLLFKKAIDNPTNSEAEDLANEAKGILESVIIRRRGQSAHASHVLGQQGLYWLSTGIMDNTDQRIYLANLESHINEAMRIHPKDEYLPNLASDIKRTLLSLAIRPTQ